MSGTTVLRCAVFLPFFGDAAATNQIARSSGDSGKVERVKKVPSVNCPTEPKSNSSLFTTARARLQK